MAQYKSTGTFIKKNTLEELFNKGVTDENLKNKSCEEYKQILDKNKVRSINIKDMDRVVEELERKHIVGKVFKATIKEMRRYEKGKLASEKHQRKRETQISLLEKAVEILYCKRNKLRKEKEYLQWENDYLQWENDSTRSQLHQGIVNNIAMIM